MKNKKQKESKKVFAFEKHKISTLTEMKKIYGGIMTPDTGGTQTWPPIQETEKR